MPFNSFIISFIYDISASLGMPFASLDSDFTSCCFFPRSLVSALCIFVCFHSWHTLWFPMEKPYTSHSVSQLACSLFLLCLLPLSQLTFILPKCGVCVQHVYYLKLTKRASQTPLSLVIG